MVQSNKLSGFTKEIDELKAQGLYKNIRTIKSSIDGVTTVDGKKVLNFCSNNYLGLANHPGLKRAAVAAIEKYGVGPAAVRTIAGTMDLHLKLEQVLAKFKGVEAVISFQGGLLANIATIPVLVGEGDAIFSDELNHASIIDGCRLSKAEVVRYKHSNPSDLEKKLKENLNRLNPIRGSTPKKLIITDGVFSMDGDIAPLPALSQLSKKYNALLMVDDAHGEGVLGRGGRGIVDYFGLHGKVDIEVGTMSKAFGVVGGYVAGKREIVELLRQKARPFLFSSAITPADVAACIEAVGILSKSEALVKKLWANADYFKEGMKRMGFDIGNSQTPIVPVMLGDASLAQKFSQLLFEKGVFAVAIGYPTVAIGKARIRVMNSASHKRLHLDKALATFREVGKQMKVI